MVTPNYEPQRHGDTEKKAETMRNDERRPENLQTDSFLVLNSSFPVPRSSFLVPRSSFLVPRSSFLVLRWSSRHLCVSVVQGICSSTLGKQLHKQIAELAEGSVTAFCRGVFGDVEHRRDVGVRQLV